MSSKVFFLSVVFFLLLSVSPIFSARMCMYIRDGGEIFYFDEGNFVLKNGRSFSTDRGCTEVDKDFCSSSDSVKFIPDSTRTFDFSFNFTGNSCSDMEIFPDSGSYRDWQRLSWAVPYVKNISINDPRFYSIAKGLVQACRQDDKECMVNEIYQYIVQNYNYKLDPRGDQDFIADPWSTFNSKAGDCEDLTGLINTLLENLNIKTFIILTDDHAYGMACGVKRDKILDLVTDGLRNTKVENMEFVLQPGQVSLRSFRVQNSEISAQVRVEADSPIDLIAVGSRSDMNKYASGNSFNYIEGCYNEDVERDSMECTVNEELNILAAAVSDKETTVRLRVEMTYLKADPSEMSVGIYEVEGEDCVVLEPTAGENGYLGFSEDTRGKKLAVNPRTWDYYNLR